MRILLLMLGMCLMGFAPKGILKTTHHTFSLNKNHKTVKIAATADQIEVLPIKGSRVVIEITVTTDNGSTRILDFLIQQERYKLSARSNYKQDELQIYMPNKLEGIFIKGEELIEQVQYKIYLPEQIIFLQTLTNQIKV